MIRTITGDASMVNTHSRSVQHQSLLEACFDCVCFPGLDPDQNPALAEFKACLPP